MDIIIAYVAGFFILCWMFKVLYLAVKAIETFDSSSICPTKCDSDYSEREDVREVVKESANIEKSDRIDLLDFEADLKQRMKRDIIAIDKSYNSLLNDPDLTVSSIKQLNLEKNKEIRQVMKKYKV